MSIELQILKSLSDGCFHSGESLASQLGVSRTTIWKEIQKLQQQLSIEIQSVKGRGYRLSRPIELLETENILSRISLTTKSCLTDIDILQIVDSSNRYLMAAASQGAPGGQIVLAEQQTAGRGRLGRTWISPFGCNIYCSLLWRFDLATSVLSGLGIVVAVALAKALSGYTEGLEIKWPNDILYRGQKLAGVLLEMQGEANGPAAVVMGLGVNVNMSEMPPQQIDQPWTDMHTASGKLISRNELAAKIIEQLVRAVQEFENQGLADFVSSWSQWDMLRDQAVEIQMANQAITGIARGIDEVGALRVETDGVVKSYMAGEASLRKRF